MTAQTSPPGAHQQQGGKSRAGRALTTAMRAVVVLVAVLGALFVLLLVGIVNSNPTGNGQAPPDMTPTSLPNTP